MMKLQSRLRRRSGYSSLLWRDSQVISGVRYAIRRVSLLQRIELTKRVRELSIRNEFLSAGEIPDRIEASLTDLLVGKLYLEWGLAEITGLVIDEQAATVDTLIDKGPETLAEEIIAAIRAELGLSEEERKNS